MVDDGRPAGPGRRGVLGAGVSGIAALGGLLGVPASAAAAAAPGDARPAAAAVPRTRARRFQGAGEFRPGFAAGTLAVRWTEGTPRVRMVAADGSRGPWRAVRGGCATGIGDGGHTGHAGPAGAEASSAFVDAGGAAAVEVDAAAGTQVVALESTATAVTALAAGVAVAGRRYLSRRAWGADESLRFDAAGNERWVPAYFPVQTLTVHHTATPYDDPDPAARMRAIYRYQAVEQDYGDFGYNLVIDERGDLYEGRWSGTDTLPGFAPDGQMVTAAHVGGYNSGNFGIALLGDFTDRPPTPAAYGTLVLVLAVLTLWHQLDPLARTTYVNPVSAVTADVPTIVGHRDWPFATQCPGNSFYPMLARLREDVAALRNGPA